MNNIKKLQQFAVFKTSNDNLYGIDIFNIKAFIVLKEVELNEMPKNNDMVKGIANIRGEPITLINLDEWLGNKVMTTRDYSIIIYCEYKNKKIGLLVNEMINIMEKETFDLLQNVSNSNKIKYLTYTEKIKDLCIIFDIERLLIDSGFNMNN